MKISLKIFLGCFVLFLASCAQVQKSKNNTEQKIQVSCPAESTATIRVLKMKSEKDQELILCGKIVENLSKTVSVLSGLNIYLVHHDVKKTKILLSLSAEESREVLWNDYDKKVLLFEDVKLGKKLPLFSQEISCKGGCNISAKHCLFNKDKAAFVKPIEKSTDLSTLANTVEGQVKLLAAAISGYEPAQEVFNKRQPKDFEAGIADAFKLRKSQFQQAVEICQI